MLRTAAWALLFVGLAAAAKDYCSLCKNHPMCMFKTNSPGKACRHYQGPAITKADKDLIVRLHNEYRNKVALGQEKRGKNGHAQPSAADMRKMVWDDETAAIAQRWANQCNYDHDKCHSTQLMVYPVDKIFSSAANQKGPNWPDVVKAWYEEVDLRDGNLNKQLFKWDSTFEDIGHYIQMVWAKSYAVGCGYSMYSTDGGSKANVHLVVCNYKPLGNNEGQYVYTVGKPASKCPAGTKQDSKYKGLCA
ncbi:hypothetical protein ONE63_001036 [Megalurothrips usitatus]|uniref:SCP domain-containing protein n=1 Tax=Megalurothrips usitatus TaxID=439358 RepID=A0AAV7XF16_9NEOP|nr:hypothetical protein ONE63_001036 [Megalurothrips usitatus]